MMNKDLTFILMVLVIVFLVVVTFGCTVLKKKDCTWACEDGKSIPEYCWCEEDFK